MPGVVGATVNSGKALCFVHKDWRERVLAYYSPTLERFDSGDIIIGFVTTLGASEWGVVDSEQRVQQSRAITVDIGDIYVSDVRLRMKNTIRKIRRRFS
jgi:hypothetical protein